VSKSLDTMSHTSDTLRLTRSLEEVAQLTELPANWDCHQSRPIQEGAARAARKLLTVADHETPPMPRIAPVPGGALTVTLRYDDRELEFLVHADGSVDFARFINREDQDDENEDPLDLDDETKVRNLVRWLVGKHEL